jgi:hypothetical protein
MTHPRERIEYTGKEVARYKEDVEVWKRDHDAVAADCWEGEDLIAKANFLFDQILRQDVRLQRYILGEGGRDDSDPQDGLRRVLLDWMSASLRVVPYGERLQREYGGVEGLDVLRENLSQAKSMLTPDDEFFDPDRLSPLRDEAIDAHRLGLTEPLPENERPKTRTCGPPPSKSNSAGYRSTSRSWRGPRSPCSSRIPRIPA